MSDIDLLCPLTHLGTNTIKTERLILRQFQLRDNADMFQWASNPDVVKFLSYEPHKTIEETNAILTSWVKSYNEMSTYNWAIEFQGVVIGNISVVDKDDECFTCHLGWQIDKPYWNKGIMTEAAKAVVDYLFDQVHYDRITSGCDTRNIGSSRVMQKTGMTLEGTFRRCCYQKDGSIGDKFYYAILESDRRRQ